MSLIQSIENQGNFLFKYRGQFPVILFLLSIPFIYLTDYRYIDDTLTSILISISIVLCLIGFLVRFYTIATSAKDTSGRNTQQQVANSLNTKGIYSIMRHPLYFGNFLIWLGIAISTFNFYFIIFMSLIFWIYYERIMLVEEKFLESKFKNNFNFWSNKVPAFFPSFVNFESADISFSYLTILRREYSSVLSAVIGFVFIELVKNYVDKNDFFISVYSIVVLIVTLIIVLILRYLKHNTTILNEDDRS